MLEWIMADQERALRSYLHCQKMLFKSCLARVEISVIFKTELRVNQG
jgi:hypothetical protein